VKHTPEPVIVAGIRLLDGESRAMVSPLRSDENIPVHLRAPRIVFYAVNGLGLGHVTRLLAIARAVRAQRPEAQILFLTTSEADSVIFHEGFAAIKIPSRSTIRESRVSPASYTKLVHSVVMNAVAAFNPAILVSDTFPAGASQELLSTLSWEMRRAFIYRAQKDERAWDPFFQAALSHYDVCITPHREGEVNIPVPATVPLVWAGPIMIRTRYEALERSEARKALGLPEGERLALVTFGGGGETELNEAVDAAVLACKLTGFTPVVVDAPLSRRRAHIIDGVLRASYYPLAEVLPAFDVAVSAAGYNSVTELVHFGIPSVLVPFDRKLDDQHARAAAVADAGAALTCPLSTDGIVGHLESLKMPAYREAISKAAMVLVPDSGAKVAATSILKLL
jgi:UDP:flavonoid glycosyltransferase YjiC (YdhE family)